MEILERKGSLSSSALQPPANPSETVSTSINTEFAISRTTPDWLEKVRLLLLSPWTMVAVALILRLALVSVFYKTHLHPERDHFLFGAEMGRVARSLVTGNGFSSPYPDPSGPTAHLTPVYPVLLAGVFEIFGIYTASSAFAILTLQSLFSSLTCLPVFLIGRRIFGLQAGVLAGWVWAFFPYSLYASSLAIWDTSLITLVMTLLVLATLHLEQTGDYIPWIGYGLSWGFAALASPATLSTLPFLGGWVWLRQWRRGSNCTGAAAVASLVFFIVVTPWIWRCSHIYGRLVPFRSIFGVEFLIGNSSDNSLPANIQVQPSVDPSEMDKLLRMGEPAYTAEKQHEAIEFVKQHPLRYAVLTLRRILNTWTGLWAFPPRWKLDGLGVPLILLYSLISLFAGVGIVLALRNGLEGMIPLLIVVIFFPLAYYMTVSAMRYRHPIDPVLMIFLAYTVTSLRWRKNEFPTATQN